MANQDAVTKDYLKSTLSANTTPIGSWVGTGPTYGTINLGFDTSKAILFAIEVLCESKESGYTFSDTFWLSKIIQQGVPISFHPYYDVTKSKHFACSLKITGTSLEMLTNDNRLPTVLKKVLAWAISGYITDKTGPTGPRGPQGEQGSGIKFTLDGNYDAEGKRIENIGRPVANQDAVTKIFLDKIPGVSLTRSIKTAGGLFTEGTPVDGLPITQPRSLSSATSKKYVDDQDNKLLSLDGSKTMTADLDVGVHKVKNVAIPTEKQDAATKEYVDNLKNTTNDELFPKQGYTVSEFNIHSRNFSNTDGKLSTFSFGVYKDFVSKYHRAHVHVVLSLATSPCQMK